MIVVIVLGGIALLVGTYFVTTYNSLVQLKHNVSKAWSNIDVLLKQRNDELPKLVETCRQHMRFERDTLEKVIRARSMVADARERVNIPALGAAETVLRGALGRLFAVAEAYPELRTSESFRELQRRITELENAIADRREFYNECVNLNNVRIEQIPDNIVAALGLFKPFPLLRFGARETRDVNVKALFRSTSH
ncbi:MAG TPA: LemA family protein [Burkholderiales bacterium]|nr:LemA family protein [Burkholderiales bacterium]